MFKLSHDGSLGQEVSPGLLTGSWLQSLDCHQHVLSLRLRQSAPTHVSELSSSDDCLYGDIPGILINNSSVRKIFVNKVTQNI